MPELRVSVLRVADDAFPGVVVCELRDSSGLAHHFEEKWPVVSAEALLPSRFPAPGYIRCRVIKAVSAPDGVEQLRISTSVPDGVESQAGEIEFLVARSQVRLVREADEVWLANMDIERLPFDAVPVLVAVAQKQHGKEIGAECPYCGSLVQVEVRGETGQAWQHSCACGRCNGVIRGL